MRTPEEPPRRQRVLAVEISSGSMDRPRAVSIPVDARDEACLQVRRKVEEEVDQDGVDSRLLPRLDLEGRILPGFRALRL